MKTKTEWNQRRETGVGEECGVFGIYDIDGKDVGLLDLLWDSVPSSIGDRSPAALLSQTTRGERGNIA